jgi:hypothetical protein
MPPFRKYSTSLAVSMRHSASKVKVEPSLRVTFTVTVWRGFRLATPVMVKLQSPVEAQAVAVLPFLELQRQHAHADKVRAVNAFKAFDNDRLDAEQVGALRRPVARRSGAIFLAAR